MGRISRVMCRANAPNWSGYPDQRKTRRNQNGAINGAGRCPAASVQSERLDNCNFFAEVQPRIFWSAGSAARPTSTLRFNERTDPCAVSGVGLQDQICSVFTAIGESPSGE